MASHLYELAIERARRLGAETAFGSARGLGWQTVSGEETLERVELLAAELAAAGVRVGSRVVLWVPNHCWTPLYLFALWRLGAVAVPLDRETNAAAAARIVAATAPALVLSGFPEEPSWAGVGVTRWWEPGSLRAPSVGGWVVPDEELAIISFTSGTTGDPKGCMLTHANFLSQLEALAEAIPLARGDRLASVLPLSHVLELTVGLLYPFAVGAAVHYVPSRRGADIVRVLSEQRITHMVGVPQLLTSMAEAAERKLRERLPGAAYAAAMALAERLPIETRRALFGSMHRRLGGCLRVFGSGGAALPASTRRFWEAVGVRVVEGYGTSETAPIISCSAWDGRTPSGSVGRPVKGVAVRLGEGDEIEVRGPNVMRGYWNDPDRTVAAFREGWYRTGDVGRVDEGGNVWLVGRAKEMIVLPSGMKVWPSDVEAALRQQAGVKDAVVVPAPTAAGGLVLHAYVIAPAGVDLSLGDIVAGANGVLAAHQRVASAGWWPADDFPRTPTLKVRRVALPVPEVAGSRGQVGARPPVAGGGDPVVRAIEAVARRRPTADDETLASLGLDSLSLLELAAALEEFTDVTVGEADLTPAMDVRAVRRLVGGGVMPLGVRAAEDEEGGPPPKWVHGRLGRSLRWVALPFRLLYRVVVTETRVEGGEHLRNMPANCVLAGTHRSWPDVMVVQAALRTVRPELERLLLVPGSAWMTVRAGVLGVYAMLAFGLYPLRQRRRQDESLRGLVRLAAGERPVLIFPQGEHVDPVREREGALEARFKGGVARLAQAMEAPVVPFGLAGSERLMVPTAMGFRGPVVAGVPVWLRRGPVVLVFGGPLYRESGEESAEFTARVEARCFQLARVAESRLAQLGTVCEDRLVVSE